MSKEMKALKSNVKKMSTGMFNADQMDVIKIRTILAESYAGQPQIPGVKANKEKCRGVEIATFTPDKQTSDHIVYYLHGGGLVTGDCDTAESYSAQLALVTGCRVVACSYRLAPEEPFPAGFDDCCVVYEGLLEKYAGSKVAFIGESGGAYLSLVVALWARDKGIQLPACVIMNSLVADMSETIKRMDTEEETTVSVAGLAQLANMYAVDKNRENPYISPFHGDYANMPPMKFIYDRDEVLAPDSKKMYEKVKAAGVVAEIAEYTGCFHAFTTAGFGSPESKEELFASAKFIQNIFA